MAKWDSTGTAVVAASGESGVIEDDAALLHATRAGDAAAFGRLYERHAGAALVVARQYTDGPADAEDVVADAFANVHRALLGGGGPEVAFRAYLFTVVRRVAAVQRTAGRRTEPTDDVATLETAAAPVEAAEAPTLAGYERSVVARAFRSLPERWQLVLWHTEVEGLTPAQIAPVVGLSANGTAALAYRAREGLRQAYLQQHLQDPLEDGCRGVAGKLGSYVRGGLATRDTRQVEGHLEDCGDCRALVLELGDVNHGMRAVVAPLVLGLLGLGALAHELPVAGGLAAGAAALGQPAGSATGAGAGGASAGGSTAGGASAGGASAGGTAAGGAAASTGVAASVGGAAATTGLVGAVASMSAGAVALVVAGVVVVAAVVVGAVQLLAGGTATSAQPSPDVSGATATASPTPGATSTPRATATPTAAPTTTPSPDAAPTDDATDRVRPGGRVVTGPGRGGTGTTPGADPTGGTVSTADPTPAPTGAPTVDPTPAPTTGPTAEPTPPPPAPADVVVAGPGADGSVSLVAGAGGQAVALTVSNAGGLPATGLTADVELPLGVTLESGPLLQVAAFGFAPASRDWQCVVGDAGHTARCTLEELPPGQAAELALTVAVDESFTAAEGDAVRLRIGGVDGRTWEPAPIRLAVAASPARLTAAGDVPTSVQVVAGRTRTVTLPLRNAGGTAIGPEAPAVVRSTLPAGVTVTADAPWVCTTGDRVASCSLDRLDAFARTTLRLALTADAEAAPASGDLEVGLTPSAHRPVEHVRVPFTVVRPAVLTLDAPGALDLAPGTDAALAVGVANGGDLAAPGAAVRLAVPGGVTLVGVAGPGWACTADASSAHCAADVAPGTDAPLTATLRATPGAVGPLGTVAVALDGTAADADVPAPAHEVALTAVAAGLSVTDATVVVDARGLGTLGFVARVAATTPTGGPGATAAGAVATVTLPPGVTLDRRPTSLTTSTCTGTGRSVVCPLGDLPAGSVVPVQLDVRAAGAVRGAVAIRLDAVGATTATATTEIVVSSANLTPVYAGVGDLDVVEAGAPLLGCVDAYGATCPAVDRERDNNGLDMRPLDDVPPAGPRTTTVPVSSQTHLEIRDARPVVWAGLYWSAVRGPADGWSAPLDTARLRAPDGTWTDVVADEVTEVTDRSGRRYFQSAVDVTDAVARGGGGAWALADAAVSAGRSDREPTYYAGWALVVVHGTPTAPGTPGASAVTVHQGGSWVGTGSSSPAFTFVGEAGASTRIGVVAWEGDRGTTGDRLVLSDVGPLTPLRWDGTRVVGGGSSSNAFDSTATGWRHPNSLGVDAKGFRDVTLPSGVGTLTATTVGDQYLLGVVTVRTAAQPVPVLQPR